MILDCVQQLDSRACISQTHHLPQPQDITQQPVAFCCAAGCTTWMEQQVTVTHEDVRYIRNSSKAVCASSMCRAT